MVQTNVSKNILKIVHGNIPQLLKEKKSLTVQSNYKLELQCINL